MRVFTIGVELVFVVVTILISAKVECLRRRSRVTKLKGGDTFGKCGLNYTPSQYDSVVIWLHGLCGSAMDWEKFVLFVINRGYLPNTKWILPTSKYRRITALNGNKCPAWFDITSFSPIENVEDTVNLLASAERIQDIIRGEIRKGIEESRIFLMGFSQGAAMALGTAITIKDVTLGGVVGISGWIPMVTQLQHGIHSQYNSELFNFKVDKRKKDSLRVLVLHGSDDVVVSLDVFTQSIAFLNDLGFKNISQRLYFGIGHTMSTLEGVQVIYEISKRLVPEKVNSDLTLIEESTFANRAYGMIMKTQNSGNFYDVYKPMPCNPLTENGLSCLNKDCPCSNSVIFFERDTFKDKFERCDRSSCTCIVVEAELEGDLYLDMDSLDTSLGGISKTSGSYILDASKSFISAPPVAPSSKDSAFLEKGNDSEQYTAFASITTISTKTLGIEGAARQNGTKNIDENSKNS